MKDIALSHLLFDGNKQNRATRNAINCVGTGDANYKTSNIMLPGYMYPKIVISNCNLEFRISNFEFLESLI